MMALFSSSFPEGRSPHGGDGGIVLKRMAERHTVVLDALRERPRA